MSTRGPLLGFPSPACGRGSRVAGGEGLFRRACTTAPHPPLRGSWILFASVLLLFADAPAYAAVPESLQIDKPQQRQLALTTQRPQLETRRRFSARVLADPQRRWRAMSDRPGVLQAPDGGFPVAGQRVAAGQLLAWLHPAISDPERRDLQSRRRAEQRDFELAQVQIRRFDIDAEKQIDISLPTPSMQIVADYHGAQARGAALDRVLSERLALKAPSAGVLLASYAQSGQLSSPGDALFEGMAADGVVIELIHDEQPAVDVAAASLGDGRALCLIGDSYDAGLRAWRALYAADAAAATLTPGQTVAVELALRSPRLWLPKSSRYLSDAQPHVWVHEGAERFVSRAVSVAAADEAGFVVGSGLGAEDRVVVDAAALLRLDAAAGPLR